MVDAISLFRDASAGNEWERQRRIWHCFGVDYQKELEKQRRIWETLRELREVEGEYPGDFFSRFQHRPLEGKIKPYVHP